MAAETIRLAPVRETDAHDALRVAGHQRPTGRVHGDRGDAVPVRADGMALGPDKIHGHYLPPRARPGGPAA
jgi:hypothetical protein